MTDMTKYKNLSLSMETYKKIEEIRKSMVQGGDVSRAKAVTTVSYTHLTLPTSFLV